MSLRCRQGVAISLIGLALSSLPSQKALAHPLDFINQANTAFCEDSGFSFNGGTRVVGFDFWLSSGLSACARMALGDGCLGRQVVADKAAGLRVSNPVDRVFGATKADTTQNQAGERSHFVGYTMLGSGLFLCSWGIASWQIKEYQDCPPRNTDNVIKIVAGILLINAGLFYLFGGCD